MGTSGDEYARPHQNTNDARMLAALADRRLKSAGIPTDAPTVSHLVGRGSANPDHPRRRAFSLQFAVVSPYAAAEILGLTEPQQLRFIRAYDLAKNTNPGAGPPNGVLIIIEEAHEVLSSERDSPRACTDRDVASCSPLAETDQTSPSGD